MASVLVKMQSSSPHDDDPVGFGKAGPFRNPLKKASPTSIFVPPSRPVTKHPIQYRQANHTVLAPKQFSSLNAGAPYRSEPAAQPVAQPVAPKRPKEDDGDEAFDPDAAMRSESQSFGAPDPYAYVDSTQANDNIKNLLEGAFDDEDDKGRTRLRRRARKAEREEAQVKSLTNKLAALDVKNQKEQIPPDAQADDEEEDDGTVDGLRVKLLPHQVEGVAWMIEKETGARKRNGVLPNGGILADDMGLGKTVQSVALMLTNPRPAPDAKPEHPKQKLPGKDVGKGTLVVAPLALIKQWESEIKSKVAKSHALKVLVHHGPNRTLISTDLLKYDVVITTYQTLTSEHAGSNMLVQGGKRVGCFGVHWYRIMLDEAHSIKNRNAKSSLACCALESWYRWCLTGTPMQNNLDELQSLIKFLRIRPYCEYSSWKEQIVQPMKNGRGGLAMQRLRYFLRAFMKRRTKDLLKQEGALNFGGRVPKEGEVSKGGMNIVKREVLTVECEFDDAELAFYHRLQDRTDRRLKDMMETSHGGGYIDALVLLLRLRQACNHPQLVEMSINKDKDAMTTGMPVMPGTQPSASQKPIAGNEMDDLTAMLGGVSIQSRICDVCQVKLSPEEYKEDDIRCTECEETIAASKRAAKQKSSKADVSQAPNSRRRNRRIIDDSDDDDDEDDDQGEWIANGPEKQINLGRAGGTDDEDAEGGGETLNSIDSVRSDDEDSRVVDSPSRAGKVRESSDGSDTGDAVDEDDEDSQADDFSDSNSDVYAGIETSGKTKHAPSTKIRHILRILHREMPKHKTIVFSQFTTMLDLIEPHLRASNMRFVRYDGSMRPDAREKSLASLRSDPKTRIMLCSLKCGSLGLNLTAASRVVIVEPFWNPFVEEQAIDRVHRLNQTVDVKVYRLTVPDTVEERIFTLQERKRELANVALEGGKGVGKLSMADILGLFRHDAVHGDHHAEDAALWEKFGKDDRLFHAPGADYSSDTVRDTSRMGKGPKANGKRTYVEHELYGRRW